MSNLRSLIKAIDSKDLASFVSLSNSMGDSIFELDSKGHSLRWHARRAGATEILEVIETLEEAYGRKMPDDASRATSSPRAQDASSEEASSYTPSAPATHHSEVSSNDTAAQCMSLLARYSFYGDAERDGASRSLQQLLRNGDLNGRDYEGRSVLELAMILRAADMVNLLLSSNAVELDEVAQMAVKAARIGDSGVVSQIFGYLHSVVNRLNNNYSLQNEFLEGVKKAASLGVIVTESLEVTQMLVEKYGADFTFESDGMDALSFAMLRSLASPSAFSRIEYLIRRGAISRNKDYLALAIDSDNFEVVRILVRNGVDPNRFVNAPNRPPAFFAVSKGAIKSLRVLAECGANLRNIKVDGMPILALAVAKQEAEAVKILVENGADVNEIIAYEGANLYPIDFAQGNQSVISYLKQKGAKSAFDENKESFLSKLISYLIGIGIMFLIFYIMCSIQ